MDQSQLLRLAMRLRAALKRLADAPDLNQDELEAETYEAIAEAYEALADAEECSFPFTPKEEKTMMTPHTTADRRARQREQITRETLGCTIGELPAEYFDLDGYMAAALGKTVQELREYFDLDRYVADVMAGEAPEETFGELEEEARADIE